MRNFYLVVLFIVITVVGCFDPQPDPPGTETGRGGAMNVTATNGSAVGAGGGSATGTSSATNSASGTGGAGGAGGAGGCGPLGTGSSSATGAGGAGGGC